MKVFEAYELHFQGRCFWNRRDEEGYNDALNCFNLALKKNPDFALAYAGKADVYNRMGFHGIMRPVEAYTKAQNAADEALGIDGDCASAYTSLAWISLYFDWDWHAAESRFRKAIELNPYYAPAHLWYKDYLLVMGRFDEAVAEMERCYQLNPGEREYNKFLLVTYIITGNYDKALKHFHKTTVRFPEDPFPYDIISKLYFQQGKYDEAIASLEKAKVLSGDPRFKEDIFGIIYAFSGRMNEANKILQKLIALNDMNKCPSSRIALFYVGMGENDKAFDWLEKAYEEHDSQLVYLKTFPEWERLRSDSRCEALLKKIGLSEK